MARKVWIVTEMLLLFVAGPALLAKLVYERHIPLFMILPAVFAASSRCSSAKATGPGARI